MRTAQPFRGRRDRRRRHRRNRRRDRGARPRPARDPRRPRPRGKPRRPCEGSFRRPLVRRHSPAAPTRHRRQRRTRVRGLAGIRRTRPRARLAARLGARLCRTLCARSPRLARRARHPLHADADVGRARPLRARQLGAALPPRVGYGPRALRLPRRPVARSPAPRAARPAVRPPRGRRSSRTRARSPAFAARSNPAASPSRSRASRS